MAKAKKKKNKRNIIPKSNIHELEESRDGGQIALKGYSYQFLYSCYLILTSLNLEVTYKLEGVEDIDRIELKDNKDNITHIQLKYSDNKQDASFLKDILENFLEAYLLDSSRKFKLVYDFPVAKGNLSKILQSSLDKNSCDYWMSIISNIMDDHPCWDWSVYNFDSFISSLLFEKVEKTSLSSKIEEKLIDAYDITTDNISLFANSIKVLCLKKMVRREYVTKNDINACILNVKDDISKGFQNPAHSWIRKIDYSKPKYYDDKSFYEGKKTTPADIVSGLPIKRYEIEKEIATSIKDNIVTVIKASSGQGKTTLALRVVYNLKDEYIPYQLLWCNNMKEIGNTIDYFKTRIQLGEKIIILIDNLDNHLEKWNHLVQCLQTELPCNYKVLITTREIDWYNYCGDLSKIHSINIVKPMLEEKDALKIFNMFREAGQLHSDITEWEKAWDRISEKQLLIEYVYLLTHGEMLSDRISAQISEIGQSASGKTKCSILRIVCFADICGVRVSLRNLFKSQSDNFGEDFGELLKSMEKEFLLSIYDDGQFIEGLHPIRSRHIVDRLHEYAPLDNTVISVIEIVRKEDLNILFSHLSEFDLNKDEFFGVVVDKLWDEKDLSKYIYAIQGLFSGSVMQYYQFNKSQFDDADAHGGLFFVSTEMCPFAQFEEFGLTANTLDKFREIMPDNKNIEYLSGLRNNMSKCNLQETYVYALCKYVFNRLLNIKINGISDIESYAVIIEWIYNIDKEFNLTSNISLNYIWENSDRLSLDCISTLMYICFCGNKNEYKKFVENNLEHILTYLKHQTKSHTLYVDNMQKAIHVGYIFRMSTIKNGNEESVSRLKYICKTLPIYDLYCADSIKPKVNLLTPFNAPDDTHKEMPIENIIIMFRQNLTSLWNKTIMSNYEFDTMIEWIEYWLDVRSQICVIAEKLCDCIYKFLGKKQLGELAKEIDQLFLQYDRFTTGERRYPKQDRPFGDKVIIPDGLGKIKSNYFQSFRNFINQFVGFINREANDQRLAIYNLGVMHNSIRDMQNYFLTIAGDYGVLEKHNKISTKELLCVKNLVMCCEYYKTHTPDESFDKYQVKKWYDKYCYENMKMVEEGLTQVMSIYSVHFPDKVYTKGILTYYPIMVNDLDFSSENDMGNLLLGCSSFADSVFDYFVIMSTNSQGQVYPYALQIPKQLFINIIDTIKSGDEISIDNLTPPYPIEVTSQILKCFSEEYIILQNNNDDAQTYYIGDIAEELWVYSMTREILTSPEDVDYLKNQLKDIQDNITDMLQKLEMKILQEDINYLYCMCDEVFKGKKYDDNMYNKFIDDLISRKKYDYK